MLSDILREKTDKWIAKHRKEQIDKAFAKGYARGYAKEYAKARAEAHAEARGRAENQKLWQAWNARRLEHQAAGKPFHEPPPSLD